MECVAHAHQRIVHLRVSVSVTMPLDTWMLHHTLGDVGIVLTMIAAYAFVVYAVWRHR